MNKVQKSSDSDCIVMCIHERDVRAAVRGMPGSRFCDDTNSQSHTRDEDASPKPIVLVRNKVKPWARPEWSTY
jgi:hypothetical protein